MRAVLVCPPLRPRSTGRQERTEQPLDLGESHLDFVASLPPQMALKWVVFPHARNMTDGHGGGQRSQAQSGRWRPTKRKRQAPTRRGIDHPGRRDAAPALAILLGLGGYRRSQDRRLGILEGLRAAEHIVTIGPHRLFVIDACHDFASQSVSLVTTAFARRINKQLQLLVGIRKSTHELCAPPAFA